jgi:hypothetical protein
MFNLIKDRAMVIRRISRLTGQVHEKEINVTGDQLDAWMGGELIQNVMPNLQVWEREFILSGITEEEWNETFGILEEEWGDAFDDLGEDD